MALAILLVAFVLIWVWIAYQLKTAPIFTDTELEEWDKPIINPMNTFYHKGRVWEKLEDHPTGEILRVFNSKMTDFEYKDDLD